MPSSKEGARSQTELENIVKSCTFNALVCVEVVIDLLLEIHKHTFFLLFFLSDQGPGASYYRIVATAASL